MGRAALHTHSNDGSRLRGTVYHQSVTTAWKSVLRLSDNREPIHAIYINTVNKRMASVESVTWSRQRSRSRSRTSAALHCLTVPEDEDVSCASDWYTRTSPAGLIWSDHHIQLASSAPSTPIKTATLRSVLRSSAAATNGDDARNSFSFLSLDINLPI